MRPLTEEERAVLAEVHRSDREEGGLYVEDVDEAFALVLQRLVALGLVEEKPEYVRISALGVAALRDG